MELSKWKSCRFVIPDQRAREKKRSKKSEGLVDMEFISLVFSVNKHSHNSRLRRNRVVPEVALWDGRSNTPNPWSQAVSVDFVRTPSRLSLLPAATSLQLTPWFQKCQLGWTVFTSAKHESPLYSSPHMKLLRSEVSIETPPWLVLDSGYRLFGSHCFHGQMMGGAGVKCVSCFISIFIFWCHWKRFECSERVD